MKIDYGNIIIPKSPQIINLMNDEVVISVWRLIGFLITYLIVFDLPRSPLIVLLYVPCFKPRRSIHHPISRP